MCIIKKKLNLPVYGTFFKAAKLGLIGLLVVSLTGCYKISQQVPLPKPHAIFKFNTDSIFVAPCEVWFQNQSYYATEFEWSFGDGRTYNNLDITHYFNDAGTYNITLKAINADGEAISITKSIEITESKVIPSKHKYDGKWRAADTQISTFRSFDFSTNRYVAEMSDYQLYYGTLNYSENAIHLSNFGNIYVRNFANNEMKLEIDGVDYSYYRENPVIPITNETLKLTNGCWVHALGVESVLANDEWLFTTAGTFVSFEAGISTFLNWAYENDSTLTIINGQNQPMRIEELTLTRLVITNNFDQTFKLNTVVFK